VASAEVRGTPDKTLKQVDKVVHKLLREFISP